MTRTDFILLGQEEGPAEEVTRAASQIPGFLLGVSKVVAVLAAAFLINWIVGRLIRRWWARTGIEDTEVARRGAVKRARTLVQTLRAAAAGIIWFVAVLIALDTSGVNVGPLTAAAGIGGVALGFGSQSLVRDFIGGFFILVENQYDVGDVVAVAGVSGLVERITLRSTVLRDLDGRRHVVPNGEIRVSSNLTKGFSRYTIDLPVSYTQDIDAAVQIVRDVAANMKREPEFAGDMLTDLEVLGVDDYAADEIVVKVYVDTTPGEQWRIGRELRRRIKRAWDRHGVAMPLTTREVILRQAPEPVSTRSERPETERRPPGRPVRRP